MHSVAQYSLGLLLVAAAASNGLIEASNLRQVPRNLQEKGDYFAEMLALVNKERAAKGKPALCMNKKLQAAAQRHSDDMAAKNYMAHDGSDGSKMSDRITDAGYIWDSVSENVAAGQPEVQSVMKEWVASEGHYANMMGDYTMFGCAMSYNANSEFGYYWTQDFATGETEACDSDGAPTPAPTVAEPTPAPTTSAPETPATVIPGTEAPEVPPPTKGGLPTPAPTTPEPVPTPAATTPAPVATPAATTPAPVATPAVTTPAPAVTPAATTAPPTVEIPAKEDCHSNF
ncbi:hypothetical protein PHYBOEH_010369 [Phytophthora boehmeriae]|uniref:SCP domain-containing protein n=1 Tax=Phytophthora boehmeriae TaxID=109152 RepID=A0A8T1VN35_9STRA|nr:hypothetical protein PHYBOEH_010369 [Phytophthora boehmeriae]